MNNIESEINLHKITPEDTENHENLENCPKQIKTQLLATVQFYQEIAKNVYDFISKENEMKNIIITENNNEEIDLDFYFNNFETILKSNNLDKLEFMPITNTFHQDLEDHDLNTDNLIDELFDSIEIKK